MPAFFIGMTMQNNTFWHLKEHFLATNIEQLVDNLNVCCGVF